MKNNNSYTSGIPDVWYSADLCDIWVEYKFLPSVPQRGIVDGKRIGLTVLQASWLAGRYKEGRNVAVIVGVPSGGVIMRNLEWVEGISPAEFTARIQPRPAIANWITQQTLS
jgi:hypothetical protein